MFKSTHPRVKVKVNLRKSEVKGMEKGDILILGAMGLIALWGMRKTTAQQPTAQITQPATQYTAKTYSQIFGTQQQIQQQIQQQMNLMQQIQEQQQLKSQISPYLQTWQQQYLNTYTQQLQQQLTALQPRTASGLPLPQPYKLPV